jgi:two-component system nitrogen regulation sensor histidine kinase NtrY
MTTRARGTGLGLAIVKKIVEEHFGTIASPIAGRRHVVTICLRHRALARWPTESREPDGGKTASPASANRT